MMKRNKIVTIVILSVTVLACGFVGWLLVKATLDRNAAENARNDDFNQVKKIYASKVFPSMENVDRVKADQKELEEWIKSTSELLHKGDLPESNLTPATFKQKLQASVRQLSRQPGIRQGKVVAGGFNFGFDQYLGESDSLPDKEHVQRLDKQLSIIELLAGELYEAKILSLDTVQREVFDTKSVVVQEPEESRRRPRRRDATGGDGSPAAAKAVSPMQVEIPEGLVSKERFTFEFTATPESFVAALNRLAAMDLFVVVAEISMQKTGDQLKVMDEKPKTGLEDGALQKKHSEKSYAERTVTNPNTDPPVSAKLVIDVYTFEGV